VQGADVTGFISDGTPDLYGVSAFYGRRLSQIRFKSGRESFESWTIFVRRSAVNLFGIGQPAERIAVSGCLVERLLSATRRNAGGAPVLFLPQAVALAACRPVGQIEIRLVNEALKC
jgi:hypothetical protein